LPAVLNAANEVAVDAFLNGKISFPGIWQTVERVMTAHQVVAHPALEDLIEADAWARRQAVA
jgi:1-deoxy-D-xylulose-5-phosphate reductoisomerase